MRTVQADALGSYSNVTGLSLGTKLIQTLPGASLMGCPAASTSVV